MDFPLESYIGAGPLKLLAGKDAFTALLGPPDRTRKRPSGEQLSWNADIFVKFTAHESADGPVATEIYFGPDCTTVSWQGMPVFGDPKAFLEQIVPADPAPLHGLGILLLRGLGIAMTGFVENHREDLSIGLFVKGHWDNDLDGMTPYSPRG